MRNTTSLLVYAVAPVGGGLPLDTAHPATVLAFQRATYARWGLTVAEALVLLGLLAGYDTAGLTRRLGIAENTLTNHLTHIGGKVGIHWRIGLILAAWPTYAPLRETAQPTEPLGAAAA